MSCEGCPSKGKCSKDPKGCNVQANPNNHIKSMIAVMSGKGGVGKSTVTVLLASALARQGLKVGILDADITGPSIPRLKGLEHEKAYADGQQQVLPVVGADGIKIMSLNYMLADEGDPVVWRGPILANVLRQLYTDVLWGELDVLLIDMPPGTGDVALTVLQEFPVNGVVMVSTPQPFVSMIVTKAIRMCEKMNIPVLGIVENMAYLDCENCDHRTLFYEEEELQAFFDQVGIKQYASLPMLDLIRNVNRYDEMDLARQKKIDVLFDDFAKELIEDLAALEKSKSHE